jgi:hypothetical protein
LGARLLTRESGCQLPDANPHPLRHGLRPLSRAGRGVALRDVSGEASSHPGPHARSRMPGVRHRRTTAKLAPAVLLHGVGHLASRCVGPALRVLPLTPQGSLASPQAIRFAVRLTQKLPSGFAHRTYSPSPYAPCASRSRIETFRRGGLAKAYANVLVPVDTPTSFGHWVGLPRPKPFASGKPHSDRGRSLLALTRAPCRHGAYPRRRSPPPSPFAASTRVRPRVGEGVTSAPPVHCCTGREPGTSSP